MMTESQDSFENVLETLGVPGKFQVTQVIFILFVDVILALSTLSFVFKGYEPAHVCNSVNETSILQDIGLSNDTTAWIEYDSCHINIRTNNTNLTNSNSQFTTLAQIACPNGRNFSDAGKTSFLSEWDLVCESKGIAEFVQTFKMLSAIVSGFTSTYFADRFGRKTILFWFIAFFWFIETVTTFSSNIYMVMGLQLFAGFFASGAADAYYILGVELMVPRYRHYIGITICTIWVFHLIVFCGIAYALQDHSWRYLQGVIAISGILSFGMMFFVKESIRWLSATNKRERALGILRFAAKQNKVSYENAKRKLYEFWNHNGGVALKDLDKIVDDEVECEFEVKTETGNLLKLIRNRHLLWVTFLMWFIRTTHNLTYYGLFMTSSSLPGNRFLTFILMALVEIPGNIIILVLMRKMNRKTVLTIFLSMSATFLMISTLLLTFGNDSTTTGVLSTVCLIMGKFAITASFNVVFVICPELYPTNIRSMGNGALSCGAKVGAMLAPFSRPLYTIAKWAPGTIYTIMCIISLIMITGLPETKNRDLPNCINYFDDRKRRNRDTL